MNPCVKRTWDRFNAYHIWQLRGTGTVLDGTVLALTGCGNVRAQIRVNLDTINRRRRDLGLVEIILS